MDLMKKNETTRVDSFWDFKGSEEFIDGWFLMSSPVPVLLISLAYLLFVLKLGPEFMKKRAPLNINNLLVLYNSAQVMISFYIFCYGTWILSTHGVMTSKCLMDTENLGNVAKGIHYYFLAKISELLDTIFFVLRKKNNQITFLHVYHHFVMMWCGWLTVKYEPSQDTIFLGTVNSFIHIVMYAYYGMSTFPQLTKYLWWKKYITSMQLIQFVAIIVQATVNYASSGCRPSYFLLFTIILNASLFTYLFRSFYKKSYLKNKPNVCVADNNDVLNKNYEKEKNEPDNYGGEFHNNYYRQEYKKQ